ncbi:putative nicotinate phosphoribosyltransferase [[Clostridium] sordellii ATCC 9714]|nr:putative nicotinate phosphoribosyltransferase [[Clostridium] sordellii ATCC 9714] [Paeniclostridium sordellii ATCC 9714]
MGGVYKLVASYKNGELEPKIKISEDPEKITNPGYKKVVRIYNEQGKAEADLVMLENETLDTTRPLTIFHPVYTWKKKLLKTILSKNYFNLYF